MTLFSKISDAVKSRFGGRSADNTQWPFVRGSYYVADSTAAVVVITLGSDKLARDLAALGTRGLCMTCPLAGSRGDIERLAHTLITNLSIQHLLCVGDDTKDSVALMGLKALFTEGGDFDGALHAAGRSKMRLTVADVAALRKQVQYTDMHGCVELDKIVARVTQLSSNAKRGTTGFVAPNGNGKGKDVDAENRVIAADNLTHELVEDKGGYFRISVDGQRLVAEHFNGKDERLRIIEGRSARSIYLTLIRNGWVSRLDHAAYLGSELTRAETALRNGTGYSQESAASD